MDVIRACLAAILWNYVNAFVMSSSEEPYFNKAGFRDCMEQPLLKDGSYNIIHTKMKLESNHIHEVQCAPDHFSGVNTIIAQSSSATVRRGIHLDSETAVVFKEFKSAYAMASARFVRIEECALSAIHHPHIVKHYCTFFNSASEKIVLVLEDIGDWSLFEAINEYPGDEYLFMDLLTQMSVTLQFLHSFGIVHRDIKPENIMLRSSNSFVLIDFGLAVELHLEDSTFCELPGGTLIYLAPELLDVKWKSKFFTPAVDWYSLGVVLYTQMTGQNLIPYDATEENYKKIVDMIRTHSFAMKNIENLNIRNLLRGLVRKDPSSRSSFQQIQQWIAENKHNYKSS